MSTVTDELPTRRSDFSWFQHPSGFCKEPVADWHTRRVEVPRSGWGGMRRLVLHISYMFMYIHMYMYAYCLFTLHLFHCRTRDEIIISFVHLVFICVYIKHKNDNTLFTNMGLLKIDADCGIVCICRTQSLNHSHATYI